MSLESAVFASGFRDRGFDAHASFRSLMDAFAHPALAHPLIARAPRWGSMSAEVVTLLLTLCDHDTPIWLDDPFACDDRLRADAAFHCASPIVSDTAAASFAFIAQPDRIGDISRFAQGEPDYPDRSTTVIVQAKGLQTGPYLFEGPGIRSTRGFGFATAQHDFMATWRSNRRSLPMGVDFVVVSDGAIAALPRSLRMVEA
jgi:alpha-D-ribose 1-methylphosphonate 5-triphosphate synthase subunit PhnH